MLSEGGAGGELKHSVDSHVDYVLFFIVGEAFGPRERFSPESFPLPHIFHLNVSFIEGSWHSLSFQGSDSFVESLFMGLRLFLFEVSHLTNNSFLVVVDGSRNVQSRIVIFVV